MIDGFCVCEHPVVDVDESWRCRRCGLDVTLFRLQSEGLAVVDDELASVRVDLLAAEARRQELVDRLSPSRMPCGCPLDAGCTGWHSDTGSVDGRLVAGVALVAVTALLVVLFWQWLVGAGVMYGAYRHLTRGARRRRPRSSVAQLVQAVGVAFAAWQSRRIPMRNGRRLRVSVPAKAGREHVDQYGEIPF